MTSEIASREVIISNWRLCSSYREADEERVKVIWLEAICRYMCTCVVIVCITVGMLFGCLMLCIKWKDEFKEKNEDLMGVREVYTVVRDMVTYFLHSS
jgi:hypothetical protein